MSGSGITAFTQAHPSNGQRVNPPPPPQVRSVTPPLTSKRPDPLQEVQLRLPHHGNQILKQSAGSGLYWLSPDPPVPPEPGRRGYPPPPLNTSPMNPPNQGQRGINSVPVADSQSSCRVLTNLIFHLGDLNSEW